jgi:hypothetical protein
MKNIYCIFFSRLDETIQNKKLKKSKRGKKESPIGSDGNPQDENEIAEMSFGTNVAKNDRNRMTSLDGNAPRFSRKGSSGLTMCPKRASVPW